MKLLSNLIAFGTGYALGAKKGYEPIKQASRWAGSSLSGKLPMLPNALKGNVVDVREVREVMSAPPETVAATAKVAEAARIMHDHDIGDVIVTEDDRPIGIITDRDIVVGAFGRGAGPSSARVADVMGGDLVTIAPTETVEEALRRMQQWAIRRLPVVEGRRVVGIVSLGDLSRLPGAGAVLADVSNAPAHT
jgi:CBS domain-containing protein